VGLDCLHGEILIVLSYLTERHFLRIKILCYDHMCIARIVSYCCLVDAAAMPAQ
jgi:hypothetical protein